MPFGGGGGTGAVTAHTHTNDFGNGGSLDETTLIQDESLEGFIVAMDR